VNVRIVTVGSFLAKTMVIAAVNVVLP